MTSDDSQVLESIDEVTTNNTAVTEEPAADETRRTFNIDDVKKLRDENAKWRVKLRELEQLEKNRQAEAKSQHEKQLAQAGEFEKLAKARKADLDTVTVERDAAVGELEALTDVLEKLYASQINDFDSGYQSLLKKMTPLNQMEWLAENQDLRGRVPKGIDPAPEGNGSVGKVSEDERRRKAYSAW